MFKANATLTGKQYDYDGNPHQFGSFHPRFKDYTSDEGVMSNQQRNRGYSTTSAEEIDFSQMALQSDGFHKARKTDSELSLVAKIKALSQAVKKETTTKLAVATNSIPIPIKIATKKNSLQPISVTLKTKTKEKEKKSVVVTTPNTYMQPVVFKFNREPIIKAFNLTMNIM